MIVEEIRDHASLLAIRPEWAALTKRVASRNPFVTPQFMLPYLDHIGTRYDCRVLVARDNDRMIGLSPTFMRRRRSGLRMRRISFPTHGTSPPFEMVVEDGREDVVAAFAEHWKASRDWDLIELQNVPATSSTEAMLRAAVARAGLRLSGLPGRVSLYVPIRGSWDDYWRSISKNARAASKRASRLCSEAGEVRILSYPADITDIGQATAWAVDIMRRSWKSPDDDPGRDDAMATFLTELAAGDLLDLCFLTINGRPVAYLINVFYKRQLNAYHTAYDLHYMPQGPSTLLLQHSISECHRRGYRVYDLLGEHQQHLRRWTSAHVQYHNLRITRDTPVARLRAEVYCRLRDWRLRRARRLTDEQKTEAKNAARLRRSGVDTEPPDPGAGGAADTTE